jgi:hypothetical protein
VRVVEHEPGCALRIRRRKEERQSRAVLRAPEHGSFRPYGIHHEAQVVHARLERGWLAETVRETCPAFVEHDDPRYRRKDLELADERRLFPRRQ